MSFHLLKRGYLAVRGLLIQATEQEQTIVLRPPQTLRGRVTDAPTGLQEAQRDTRYSAETDAQGRVVVRDLPVGQVFFSVTHEDWPATMWLEPDFSEQQVDLVSRQLTRKCVRLRKAGVA